MTGKATKPIPSLAALLDAITDRLDGIERRLGEKQDAILSRLTMLEGNAEDIHNRLVSLEDRSAERQTEAGERLDEIRDGVRDIQNAVDKFDTDDIAKEIRFDLNELVDDMRRRDLADMRSGFRRAS